jgi:hypothetical protein
MTDDQDLTEQTLRYYERKQSSGRWSGFINLFFDELLQSAGEQDGRAFLCHIGRRLGESTDLGTHDTLESLQDAMNRYLEQVDWGLVTLAERNDGLLVRHSAYPLLGQQLGAEQATVAMAAILEGLYSAWLNKQSGDDSISLRRTRSGQRRVLAFVYGRN